MPDQMRPDEPRRADDRLHEANEQLTLTALRSLNEADASAQRWRNERTLNDDLLRKQRLLRLVTSQLSLTEQRERKRLATDLHDYLAQMLVLGRLKVGQARPRTVSDPTLVTLMETIDDIFSQSLSYTRTLMTELCPPVLYDLGLLAALKWLADQISQQYPITVDLQVPQEHVVVSENQAYLL